MAFASYVFNATDEVLTRTLATVAPNTTIITISFWLKTSTTDGFQLFTSQLDANNFCQFLGGSTELGVFRNAVAGVFAFIEQTQAAFFVVTDTWHHCVMSYDSTQGTADNRCRFWVNGTQVLDDTPTAIGASETHGFWTNGSLLSVGNLSTSFKAKKMAFIDVLEGVVGIPTDFALDNGGTWTRKTYTGSYGTYGFSLDGSDGFDDVSGNGQDFTGVNMDASNLDAGDLPPFAIESSDMASDGVAAGSMAGSSRATAAMSAAGTSAPVMAAEVIASAAMSASGVSTAIMTGEALATAAMVADGASTAIAVGDFTGGDPVEEVPPPVVDTSLLLSGTGAGGGGGMLAPHLLKDELRRLERRQRRTPKTHVIKIGDWPEEVGFVETDPLDMGEILRAQPTRSSPQHSDGDDEEEALMLLLALAA
jgi:hypothetical protein